jgi:hypothetical protein
MLCTLSVPLLGRINLEFGTAVKLIPDQLTRSPPGERPVKPKKAVARTLLVLS